MEWSNLTSVILERMMNACNVIINSSMKELYVDFVILFSKVYEKYPNF